MAVDPICGMTVDERTALSAKRDGATFYFCSEYCRRKYLAGEGNTHDVAGHQLVTLNSPNVKPRPAHQSALYTCPMHPEIEQDHPGTCPKCGMALEPKTITAATEDDGE